MRLSGFVEAAKRADCSLSSAEEGESLSESLVGRLRFLTVREENCVRAEEGLEW